MKIIREHSVPVKRPELLPVKDGMPWCEDHEEYFERCDCPKPHSTPEEDGWQVEQTPSGPVGFPTEELYKGLSLWIQRRGEHLICIRCNGRISFPAGHVITESESQDMVESFFDIHSQCGGG